MRLIPQARQNTKMAMSIRRKMAAALILATGLATACQQKGKDPLAAGVSALDQRQYEQAVQLANDSLRTQKAGEKAARALYIRGQACEHLPAADYSRMLANMQGARSSYVEALGHNPPKPLSTYIRAALGKVAFYQDDFQTAIQQLRLAYSDMREDGLKAASLYYLGKSQQRSGQFEQADSTFADLISHHGSTDWADKAKESQGARAFYLQLGVYEKPSSVDGAAQLVRQRGLNPARYTDSQGRYVLRAGPFANYAQAKQLRPRIADAFTDAMIVP